MKFIVLTASILIATACASKPEIINRIPFNPVEFAKLPTSGTAIVTGQAFLKTADGKIYYPQRENARLNPKTSYSKQWYEVNYIGKKNITKADPRYLDYIYKSSMDKKGRFTFKKIPGGDYYISAPIFWMKEIKMEDGTILMKRQGAFICHEIHVDDGQTVVTNITSTQPVNSISSNQ